MITKEKNLMEVFPSKITLSDLDIYECVIHRLDQDLVYERRDVYNYSVNYLEHILNDPELDDSPHVRHRELSGFWSEVLSLQKNDEPFTRTDNSFHAMFNSVKDYSFGSELYVDEVDIFNTNEYYYTNILENIVFDDVIFPDIAFIGNGKNPNTEYYATYVDCVGQTSELLEEELHGFEGTVEEVDFIGHKMAFEYWVSMSGEAYPILSYSMLEDIFMNTFSEVLIIKDYSDNINHADTIITAKSNIVFIVKSTSVCLYQDVCHSCPKFDHNTGQCSISEPLDIDCNYEGIQFIQEYIDNCSYVQVAIGEKLFLIDLVICSDVEPIWLDEVRENDLDVFSKDSLLILLYHASIASCASCYVPEDFYNYLIRTAERGDFIDINQIINNFEENDYV